MVYPKLSSHIICLLTIMNLNYFQKTGYKVITSSPDFLKSNGLAENGVNTCKQLLIICSKNQVNNEVALLEYRCTPISSLGVTPLKKF